MTTPAGDPMRPKSTLEMFSFRLDPALIERLKRYAEDLSRGSALRYTQVDALRLLLTEALDLHDAAKAKKRR